MGLKKLRGFRSVAGMVSVLALLSAGTAVAEGRQLTAQDYARAERFMPYNTEPLVDHDVRGVHWLDNRRFWFLDHDSSGDHYQVMAAASGRISPAFDQQKLAAALGKAAGEPIAASKLAITEIRIGSSGQYEI